MRVKKKLVSKFCFSFLVLLFSLNEVLHGQSNSSELDDYSVNYFKNNQILPHRSSDIAINYQALAPYPLSAILSQAEEEWVDNLSPAVGTEKAQRFWQGIAQGIASGNVSDGLQKKLQKYAPQMLTNFATILDPNDEKYGYLWSIGTNYIAKGFSGSVIAN